MEKVLVTGANGFLGANVVRQLLKSGYTVRAMVRPNANRIALAGLDCEFFQGQITQQEALREAVAGCQYVVHSAALTDQKASFQAYEQVNIKGTEKLITAALHHDVKRFICVSTANCQTNGTLTNPGDESGGFMPWLKGSGYAYSKFLAQQLVLDAVKEKDLPGLIVQPTFLVGPYDARPSSGALLLHGLNKRIVFHPRGGKNFVDVASAAAAIVNALTKGKIGETYLLAGQNLSYAGFYKKVHAANHQNSQLIPIPSMLLFLAGFILGNLSKVFHFKTGLTPTNARLLTLGNYFTGKKAEQDLGMPSTDIDHAIQKALEWFEAQDYIA